MMNKSKLYLLKWLVDFVASEQILEEDWQFNGYPNNPPILFQNDFSSKTFFHKISTTHLSNKGTINDADLVILKELGIIRRRNKCEL